MQQLRVRASLQGVDLVPLEEKAKARLYKSVPSLKPTLVRTFTCGMYAVPLLFDSLQCAVWSVYI